MCWAHLVRKFVSYSERDGPGGKLGEELLEYTSLLFEYWSRFREGHMSRETLVERMAPVRLQIEVLLQRLADAKIQGVSGSCADILAHRAALWTFVERPGVEPTNNHAERELRGLVLWRRRSFGSQSDRGTRFSSWSSCAHESHGPPGQLNLGPERLPHAGLGGRRATRNHPLIVIVGVNVDPGSTSTSTSSVASGSTLAGLLAHRSGGRSLAPLVQPRQGATTPPRLCRTPFVVAAPPCGGCPSRGSVSTA